jgi:hypothetical protein
MPAKGKQRLPAGFQRPFFNLTEPGLWDPAGRPRSPFRGLGPLAQGPPLQVPFRPHGLFLNVLHHAPFAFDLPIGELGFAPLVGVVAGL